MNWTALAAVAELVGALGMIATLAYLALQVRQNSKLLEASLADSARQALTETTRVLAADREAARVFWAGLGDRSSLTELDRQQFDALLTLTFYGYQQFFAKGQLEEFAGILWVLRFPGARDWFATYATVLPAALAEHIQQILERGAPAA